MTPDTGTLTAVLRDFLTVFKLGQVAVSRDATSLLSIIAAIELTLAGLAWAGTGSDAMSGLFRKILTISFFVFVIDHYDTLLRTVIGGFIHVGKTAATGSTDVFASFQDPSSLVDIGFQVTIPIVAHLQAISYFPPPMFDILFSTFSLLCILAAFFVIAIQVFITYLEFAMISTLALIFVPFGVFRHTSFLTEKTFGAVISFGVKLMVLGLIVSVATPLLRTLELPEDPSFSQLIQMLIICLSIAALSWHAPGLAAGLLAGGPSLSAINAAQTGMAGAVGAAAIPVGIAAAARETRAAASYGLGKVSGLTSRTATDSSGGTRGNSSSGEQGAGGGGGSIAVAQMGRSSNASQGAAGSGATGAKSTSQGAEEGRRGEDLHRTTSKESFREGGPRGGNAAESARGDSNATVQGSAMPQDNIVRFRKSSKDPLKASTVYEALTPDEARPSGGAHVPIRENEENEQ